MHLIECDGCKRQEVFYSGLKAADLHRRGPESWGWRAGHYNGGHDWGMRTLLLHACNLDCVVSAVVRARRFVPGLSLRDEDTGHFTRWEGFQGATPADWDALYAIKPEDGGHVKEAPKSRGRVKKSLASWAIDIETPSMGAIQQAGFGGPAPQGIFHGPTIPPVMPEEEDE